MGENERKEHSIMEAFKETALALQKQFREQGEKIYSRIVQALFEPPA